MYDDMQPDNIDSPNIATPGGNVIDNEGAMAKADLYKLANYSFKLFKKIDDGDQLEAWVQAKITKAADYIASVYHYLEYEMQFSEYGKKIENSDMYSESQKIELKNRLLEAKDKLRALKVAQAEKSFQLNEGKKKCSCDDTKESHSSCPVHGKMEEGFSDNAKVGDTFKTQHGTATKTATGVKHTRDAKPEDDEDYVAPKKPSKAAKTAAEKKADKAKEIKLPKPAKGTRISGMKDGQKYEKVVSEADKGDMDHDGKDEPDSKEYMDNKDAAIKKAMGKKDKKVDEAAKPDYIDLDKDGNKKEPMKKAAKDAKSKKVDEAAPSAGMTKKEKSAVVKKAKAGEDIGKPGKGFAKVEKAAKAGGAKDPKAVAAAAMWKNAKKKVAESFEQGVEQIEQPEGELDLGEGGSQVDQLKAMLADPKYANNPAAKAQLEKRLKLAQDRQSLDAGEVVGKDGMPIPVLDPDAFAKKNPNFKEEINESTDLARMKEFLTRLNG